MKNKKNIKSPKSFLVLIIAILIIRFIGLDPFVDTYTDDYEIGSVTRVVDGDTAIINIDGIDERVRFTSINTPEYDKVTGEGDYFGKEAYEFTKRELDGKKVWLEMDVTDRDQYDRLLRYIWLSEPKESSYEDLRDNSFNGILVSEGYAFSGNYKPDTKYKPYLDKMEEEAKINKKGMWK